MGYVIDGGQVKQKQYNENTGLESLEIVNISKVQAIQRAGRAGRTREGKCIRLYAESFYDEQMPNITLPEILRVNLTSTVLTLKSLGIEDVINFEYMDKPNTKQLQNSLIMLRHLEAVSSSGRLTNLGRELAKLPIDPCFAKALLYGELLDNSKRSKVQEDILKLVSVLSTENIFANVSRNDSRAQ